MSDYKHIKTWQEDNVAYLALAEPPLNVLNIPMMREINLALDEVKKAEAGLKALVITSEGEKAFSAGVDVADHTEDKMDMMIEVFHAIFHHLENIEVPVVAAVKGAALGGGCELAIACDMVVAADTLKIGQPEIQVGVFPPVAAVLLPRLIADKKAFELLLGGAVIKAEEARALGLVNHVWPLAEFDERLAGFLSTFKNLSGPVMRLTKRAIRQARGSAFDEALSRVESLYLGELMDTEDAHEGLAAFLEKRKPVWKDK